MVEVRRRVRFFPQLEGEAVRHRGMAGLGAPELMMIFLVLLAGAGIAGLIWAIRKGSSRSSDTAPAPGPSGWLADPSGHQYRYWDGSAWTDHVSDNGAVSVARLAPTDRFAMPLPTPTKASKAGPLRWYEPLVYIAILAVWMTVTIGVGTVVANASLEGKVATTQAEADQYNADANGSGRGATIVVALIAMAFIAQKVGYRGRDAFMLLIPIWGFLITFKLLWRLACLNRHYWAPAPTKRVVVGQPVAGTLG